MAKIGNNRGLLLVLGILLGLVLGLMIPFAKTNASATYGSSDDGARFMICTAELEPGFEGVYYLDTRTGDLRAAFFNPRTRKINALYEYNILNDFKDAATKTPKFLMVSGSGQMQQNGNIRFSTGTIYIVEERSGMMCAYSAAYAGARDNVIVPYKGKIGLLESLKFGSQAIRESK